MPDLTPRALAQAQARREREAAALRENLRRRKVQIRVREEECNMPTIFRSGGFRVYFYSRDPNEPPHVHVDRAGSKAKVWLDTLNLASNVGYSPRELADVLVLIRDNQTKFLEVWHDFFDPNRHG